MLRLSSIHPNARSPLAVVGLCALLGATACGSSNGSDSIGDQSGGARGDSGSANAGGAAQGAGGSGNDTGGTAAGGTRSAAGGGIPRGGAGNTGAGGQAAGGGSPGAGGASGSKCNQPISGNMGACAGTFPSTSIAAMRKAQASGCFELTNVGLVARTDSPTEPRIYVQDATTGDLTAVLAKCAATATHACPAAVKAAIPQLYDTFTDGAKLSLRGYYQYGGVTGFEEFYIEDIVDTCSTLPRPAPIKLTVAELSRDARTTAKWFQRATIDVPSSDPLVMYDLSPPELLLGQPTCPDSAGFGMIPRSAGASAPAACAGMTNPAARTPVDPKEILVGRQFFNQFLYSADCACAGTTQRIVTPTSSVSGAILGYLILEQDKGSTTAYQVFEPAADQSFPIK